MMLNGGSRMKARKGRGKASQTNYLRIAIGVMCLLSFLVTFMYVDTSDMGASNEPMTNEREKGEEAARGNLEGGGGTEEGEIGEGAEVEGEEGEEGDEGEREIEAEDEDNGALGGNRLAPPEVVTIRPFHGPAVGGTKVTIVGHNFVGDNVKASVGDIECEETEVLDHENVVCTTPPGVGARLSVGVQKGEDDTNDPDASGLLRSPDNTLFSYDDPVVENVVPGHGPTSGGTRITITGLNFGPAKHTTALEATVGGSPCLEVDRMSDNTVTCLVPLGTAGAKSVVVAVGGMEHRIESRRNHLFAYVLTAEERLTMESSALLDGLTVRYDRKSVPLILSLDALTGPNEIVFKDLFSGRTSAYSVTPDMVGSLPNKELTKKHSNCAVVGNHGSLLEARLGEKIDRADAVFRFNNAPTDGYEDHVGGRTDYRMVQTRFLRGMLSRDPTDVNRIVFHPSSREQLIVWSEYAQDLFVAVNRAYQKIPMFYMSRALLGNVKTLYQELRRRFDVLGVGSDLAEGEESQADRARADAEGDEGGGGDDGGGGGGGGGEEEAGEEEEERRRRLLALPRTAHLSGAELQRLSAANNALSHVEPLLSADDPPAEFITVMFALQMCKKVSLYGYKDIVSSSMGGAVGPYFAENMGSEAIFDIKEGLDLQGGFDVDLAIMKLLEVSGFMELM